MRTRAADVVWVGAFSGGCSPDQGTNSGRLRPGWDILAHYRRRPLTPGAALVRYNFVSYNSTEAGNGPCTVPSGLPVNDASAAEPNRASRVDTGRPIFLSRWPMNPRSAIRLVAVTALAFTCGMAAVAAAQLARFALF